MTIDSLKAQLDRIEEKLDRALEMGNEDELIVPTRDSQRRADAFARKVKPRTQQGRGRNG